MGILAIAKAVVSLLLGVCISTFPVSMGLSDVAFLPLQPTVIPLCRWAVS